MKVEFDQKSPEAEKALKEYFTCGCEPYKDIFTFRLWNEQGFRVKKGSKSLKRQAFGNNAKLTADAETEKPKADRYNNGKRFNGRHIYHVFCRCQVE